MQETSAKVLLFGDENVDKHAALEMVTALSSLSAGVRKYLDAAFHALKQEAEKACPGDLAEVESLEDIVELAELSLGPDNVHDAAAAVVASITRTAELISYVEKDASILGTTQHPATVLGFCAGELPGAVAVAASNMQELVNISLEMVRVLFRFWYEMKIRTIAVDDTDGNWGVTVMGVTQPSMQAILDDFHNSEKVPHARRICIGVVSEGWITIVGCPASIDRLLEWSDEIGELPRMETFGRGSVHMHNLPELHLDTILGRSPLLGIPIGNKARMLSPYSCKYRQAPNLRSLLGQILSDISSKTMHVSSAVRECVREIECEETALFVAGYTAHTALVQKEMLEAGIDVYVTQSEG